MRKMTVPCCICEATTTYRVASGWDFEYGTTQEDFFMQRCTVCGHYYLNPRPAEEEFTTIYPKNYYTYDVKSSVHPIALKAKQWLEKRKLKKLLKLCKVPVPRVLDVGCGDGRVLEVLHQMGIPPHNLSGVEMLEEPLHALRAQGFHTYLGRMEDLSLPEASYDLIVILQVIEHVDQPAVLLKQVARLLAPGGILVIETPNMKSLDARIFRKRYWGGYHFPRHWNLFYKDSLIQIARKSELDLVRTETFPCAVFWIYPFHHWLREKGFSPRIYRIFWPIQAPLLLTLAMGIDLILAPFGLTSNLRGIFRTRNR